MLPCIYFIFSRRGCDDAVKQCLFENMRLTSSDELRAIVDYAEDRLKDLPRDELEVLGYSEWIAGLSQGIAAHHAGMIPPFKETVEELFKQNLIKAVFATETLALGINMPARTVAIESLTKFTGERHELMTPGEYTQLSGRAGRRGIDELGHSVVLYQRFTPFDTITRLASTRTYPLNSSFRPSYNMAVNLVRNYDRHDAEHLVNSSFAQFQADRDVVQLERTRERSEAYLASYRERMQCDLGDFGEYRDLVAKLRKVEDRLGVDLGSTITEAMTTLRPGDVIEIQGGRRRGRYAVIDVTRDQSEGSPRVLAVSEQRNLMRLTPSDFRRAPVPMGRIRIAFADNPRNARTRRHIARLLANPDPLRATRPAPPESKELRALRRSIDSHPCHSCPDRGRHLHFADRARRLEREVAGLERRINRRTGTLARRFELVLEILDELGYVAGWELTDRGETLTAIYNESDLLVVEALTHGLFDELDAPELAAVCSTLVFETRGPEPSPVTTMPTSTARVAWKELMALWEKIKDDEEVRGLDLTREPDPGFAERAYRWAAGSPLEYVIGEDDPPGDFFRNVKQLIDLLRQIEVVSVSDTVAARAGAAVEGLNRGVVAYSSLEF
jgi:ATP-dependent RNA helicase HelY